MFRRIKLILFTASILLFIQSYAQHPVTDSLPAAAGDSHTGTILPLHKLHVGVQAGTEFMTTSGYGSGFSTFLSPTLTYPLSKRFLISGGISVVNTSFNGYRPYYFPETGSFSGNLTQTTLWVSGQYLLNDRLTITGTAWKTFDITGNKPGNYPFYKTNPQGAYFNVGYKVTDNFHIEAGFGYSQGSHGYYNGYPGAHGFGSTGYEPFFNR